MSGIRFGGWNYYKWRQVRCFSYTAHTTADCLLQNNLLHRIQGTERKSQLSVTNIEYFHHRTLWLMRWCTGVRTQTHAVSNIGTIAAVICAPLKHLHCDVYSLGHDVCKLPRYEAAITIFSDFTWTSHGIQIFNNSINFFLLVTRPHVTKRTCYEQLANVKSFLFFSYTRYINTEFTRNQTQFTFPLPVMHLHL